MIGDSAQEDVKLDAMQRVWQSKRMSAPSIYEVPVEFETPFSLKPETRIEPKGRCKSLTPNDREPLDLSHVPTLKETPTGDARAERSALALDASTLGDLPARYKVYGLKPHQQPVVGVYVDGRVRPGFKYKVQPLPGRDEYRNYSYLFEGKALALQSVGRGYARRFTFEAEKDRLNNNDNYFWSDSRPEGYAFELELVSDGDKFTVFDANHGAQGTLEILKIKGAQIEIGGDAGAGGGVQKKAKINFTGKVEFYETGVAKPMPMSGVVVSVKEKGQRNARVVKIVKVNIRRHRYYLVPGVQKTHRRVTVRGEDIGDVPTKYTMTGLEPYEIPVVGTYVDPRIVPGFHYKVRPNDRKEHLFQGRALKLRSVGMGYAKRLTFEPDSLVAPDNYLWSDNHPDGLGLEPRAVHVGMKFSIAAGDRALGEATVFRADAPQIEEKMEKTTTRSGGCAIVKYIHVDVTCHVKLGITGGHSDDREEHLMRVYGLAAVRKEPNEGAARVVRVDNVGLDSQLNVLFAHTHTGLTFLPLE